MLLTSVQIFGFQSFADSGPIRFGPMINLIIGQNNSGKSAVLRALQSELPDDRHCSPDRWQTHQMPTPKVRMTISISGHELYDETLKRGQQRIPSPTDRSMTEGFLQSLWAMDDIEFVFENRPQASGFSATKYPSHGLFVQPPNIDAISAILNVSEGKVVADTHSYASDDTLPSLMYQKWREDMFFFSAERFAMGQCAHQHAIRLAPNASNLPAVLDTLKGSRGAIFDRLVCHLREIFSTVGNMSVRPHPSISNTIEVRVWPTSEMDRVELSFPLNSSGTGVSQVIAILTAIMTMDQAVIVIDEINSFLHPAAVKALLRIIQTEYNHHQYIISTHAPEVIGFANPDTIHLVRRSGYESSIESLSIDKVEDLRLVADHLGVSMADVFAAERVVWVEGPTEELCFPFLYRAVVGVMPRGTVVTAVSATGDFNTKRRDREIVYQVYSRLSGAVASLPVSVAFSFDTEQLTDADKEKMSRDSRGMLRFLPRRHFEYYLIDPPAIANFIVDRDPSLCASVTPDVVAAQLRAAAQERDLLVPQWDGILTSEGWTSSVDAASLISRVVARLSNHRVTFKKKNDSMALMKHMIVQNSAQLQPLIDYVKSLIEENVPILPLGSPAE